MWRTCVTLNLDERKREKEKAYRFVSKLSPSYDEEKIVFGTRAYADNVTFFFLFLNGSCTPREGCDFNALIITSAFLHIPRAHERDFCPPLSRDQFQLINHVDKYDANVVHDKQYCNFGNSDGRNFDSELIFHYLYRIYIPGQN